LVSSTGRKRDPAAAAGIIGLSAADKIVVVAYALECSVDLRIEILPSEKVPVLSENHIRT
jgi:hypothetical protein